MLDLPAELLNCIDEIIVSDLLTEDSSRLIVNLLFRDVQEQLASTT